MNRLKRVTRCLLREGHFYPVLFGPLRGLRVCADRSVNGHQMLGFWERENFSLITKLVGTRLLELSDESIIYDIGANVGLYSLYFARLLAGRGIVFAFEPASVPREVLQRNLEVNRFTNVVIEAAACADATGERTLYLGPNHHISSLYWERAGALPSAAERSTVRSYALDDHWALKRQADNVLAFVKMDVEGAADQVLQGCSQIAATRCFLLLESHSPAEDLAIGKFALDYEFKALRVSPREWVRNLTEGHPSKDGVWGTILLVPHELASKVAAAGALR